MKYRVLIVSVIALLSACGGGHHDSGEGEPAQLNVKFSCAGVANVGEKTGCEPPAVSLFIGNAHALDVVRGDVIRSQEVAVAQRLDNLNVTGFTGWIEAEFDAGCGGAPTWKILPRQAITIAPTSFSDIGVSGQCGDMPLGGRTLTARAYAADGVTVLDEAIVRFTLKE